LAELSPSLEQSLSEARHGSREALGQVLQLFRGYLLQIAERELDCQLRAKGGASDLVQEAFLEANRAFPRFDGKSAGELRAWLRKLLLDRVGKWKRRYRTTQKRRINRERSLPIATLAEGRFVGALSPLPSPSDEAMAHEQVAVLHMVLGRLPEDYRRVIALRYQDNLSFELIGARMGRSANAACLLWLRALERVKQELDSGT
jgi:RNA polymerase sigma-70 factor (ECF subfamily)